MQMQERLIVPGLGVVILLSAFILGVPLVYKLLLGLLGLAAAGTYFAPPLVQVETRVVIAAVGLIILLIGSSVAFWLTLMAFGAIAAMQFPHRHELQRNPATIAWLSAVLGRQGAAGGTAQADAGDGAGGAAPSIALPAKLNVLQGRVSIAGIAAVVLGVVILLTAVMPWYSAANDRDSVSFSGWELAGSLAEAEDTSAPYVFVWVLAALAVASLASVVLPRIVPIITGVAGLAASIITMGYIYGATGSAQAAEAGVTVGFGIGAYLTALAFIVIAVLHLIPALHRPIGGGRSAD